MTIKLLQLNIYQGKYIDRVAKYIKKNDVDIVCFQELTGGKFSMGGVSQYPGQEPTSRNLNTNTVGVDGFDYIHNLGYTGEIIKVVGLKDDPTSYKGNAIFYKKKFVRKEKKDIWFSDYKEFENVHDAGPMEITWGAISVAFENEGKEFHVITCHLPWGPNPRDEEYKIVQNKILYEYAKSLTHPFVLTGDFNQTPDTQIVTWLSSISKDWTTTSKTTNTLNPDVHVVRELFPKGYAVDYIFTSPAIKVKSFRVVREIDLSDHYGLLLEFEV